ncbi:MAG: hypothetical protein HWD84_10560 [Flavobacteriaceae bacterium]|nr:hypothetical protein [Flavobacteriaceae bacterium]
MKEIKLSRIELYERVWKTPLTSLAKEFKISDNGLRKKCIKHNIPLPGVGHWSKVEHGKRVNKTPLPNPKQEIDITFSIQDDNGNYYDPSIDERIRVKHEIATQFTKYLKEEQVGRKFHPLVELTKNHLKNKKSNYDSLYSTDTNYALDIHCSKLLIPSALKIFNSFILLAEARGHSVKISSHCTIIDITGVSIKIDIKEKHRRVIDNRYSSSYDSYKLVPTGILNFRRTDHSSRYWDNSKKSIQEQFPSIFANLESYAIYLKDCWARNEIARKEREQEETRLKEIQKRKDNELSEFNSLLNNAQRWQQAKLLREYIEQTKSNVQNEDWVQWALDKADWLDPIIEKEDEILGNYRVEQTQKERP